MQVWSENDMVGELNVRPQQVQGSHLVLHLRSDELSFVPGSFDDDFLRPVPSFETLTLRISERSWMVDDRQLELVGGEPIAVLHELRRRNHVPVDAVVEKRLAMSSTLYRWRVLDLSASEVEKIFDLDDFEPVEFGEPDIERRRMEINFGPITA